MKWVGAENERRRVGDRGVWGHPPPEYFEIESLGNRIYSILLEILLEIISLDKA